MPHAKLPYFLKIIVPGTVLQFHLNEQQPEGGLLRHVSDTKSFIQKLAKNNHLQQEVESEVSLKYCQVMDSRVLWK